MKIPKYKILEPLQELGTNAEIFIDQNCYDVSGMNVLNMMVVYEPEITGADKVTLVSEDAGTWKWNRDRKKWERMWN